MELPLAPDRLDALVDVQDVEVGAAPHPAGWRAVKLHTGHGPVALRCFEAPGADHGVVWVGGVGGRFDSPGAGLYPTLGAQLVGARVASAQVRFRHPGSLDDCVLDALAGGWFLREHGVAHLAAVGHSFGGAVVVRAAAADPSVRTVVTLASQGAGTEPVSDLGARGCSLLAVHGARDQVLPEGCSRRLVDEHGGDAELVVYERAGHVLDAVADELGDLVLTWLVERLLERDAGELPRA